MNKKTSLLISIISLVIILSLCLTPACKAPTPTPMPTPTPTPEVKKLQIGALHSLSGWFSSWDVQSLNEAQIIADLINERGGITIKGQKYEVELVAEDCKSTLDGVAAAANTLIYDKKVKFMVGPGAFFPRAVAPIATANKVISVLGYTTYTEEEISPNTPYTFIASGGPLGRVISMVKLMKDKFPQFKNLCMVSPVGGIHPRLEKWVRNYLASEGYNIVGEWVIFADDAVDWAPYAAKINANKEADCVFWLHFITFHVGNMTKALREIGYDKWILGMSCPSSAGIIEITGKAAATKLITQGPVVNAPGNPADLDLLMNRALAKYGTGIDTVLESSNALYVLAQVLQKAQSLDPDVVKATWEGLTGQTIQSLWGPSIPSGEKSYGIAGHVLGHPWPYTVIDNGEYAPFRWYDSGPVP